MRLAVVTHCRPGLRGVKLETEAVVRGVRPPPGRTPHVPPEPGGGQWRTVGMLLPYLWAYKARAAFALLCLIAAGLVMRISPAAPRMVPPLRPAEAGAA